jgi:cell division protease FtsH
MKKGGMGMGGGDESIFSMGKSQGKLVVSNVKFSDVAGINEEKDELIEIVDYLKRPAKYAAMGARTPKGVILYGPPGTGKTLLAKAVAGEAKVPFFQVSGSAFEDMLVGVGAKRVRDLFAKARKSAPAIIFIDEIDSVASKRGKFDMSGGGGIADQTINQLLAEMDGFSTKAGVVVIAATNRLDSLDDAILRPGRFDRHIQVNLPDIKEREEILKIHAKNKNISSAVSFTDVARRTPGMSGAQLENVLNEATLLAVRFNKTTISMKEIDEAIDRVIAGPAKKSRVITEAERKHIATHEAGHALVGLYTSGADIVEKITIIPRGMAAGYTVSNPEKQETQIKTKKELIGMITTLLGGRAAEEIQYSKDDVSTGASNDLYRASQLSRAMVMQLGMSDVSLGQLIPSEGTQNPYAQKLYSEATAQKADIAVEKIIQDEYSKAKAIVSKNKKELNLIVDTLLILETIVKDQIDYIHKNKKLPPEAIAAQKASKAEKVEKVIAETGEKETKTKKSSKKEPKVD